jgi:Ca-activated chloride channel family protein
MKKFIAVLLLAVMLTTGCMDVYDSTTGNRFSYDEAVRNLSRLYRRVNDLSIDDPSIYDGGTSEFWLPEDDVGALLPDFHIGRQPAVNANRSDALVAVIVSSTEKAVNNETDRWLIDVAEAYNNSPGRLGSIELWGVASGEMFDYIRTNRFVPDGWTPSNRLWGDAIGIAPDFDRMAGNIAGIVSRDGLNAEQVIQQVEAGTLNFGYTNPNASSTGANFLMLYINEMRSAETFSDFQRNISLVSYTTPQMRNAALSGRLDAFVYESQQFKTGEITAAGKTTTLAEMYQFVPFGVRHDNPMYVLSESRRELIEHFTEFAINAENQALASQYGFNQFEDYAGSNMSGATLLADQRHYKEFKSGGRPIVSVFVCDLSGSMAGTPLNALKRSLRSSAGMMSPDSYIGLVTFASDVRINLPIARFDDSQRDRFLAATEQMTPRGATAIYSALVVASQMIVDHKEANPDTDAIYRIFLLTDGDNNEGLSKSATMDTLGSLGVPIYCIGYNDGSVDLDDIAALNEAPHIRINDQNVDYALANFFKAEF